MLVNAKEDNKLVVALLVWNASIWAPLGAYFYFGDVFYAQLGAGLGALGAILLLVAGDKLRK